MFVIMLSFLNGLYNISNLSMFLYLKDELKIHPDEIQLIEGIINLPWCFKFIFGYLLDKF